MHAHSAQGNNLHSAEAQVLNATTCCSNAVPTVHVQAHINASSIFDAGAETMSVKLTIKRMQGYAALKKAVKLNMALISRLKLLGKAVKDKASLFVSLSHKDGCKCTCF